MRTEYEIIDVAWLELERTMAENIYNVRSLMVEPQYQGLGIGSALMRVACKDADEQGIPIWLVPQSINMRQEDLIRFYERLGFERLGGSGYWRRLPKTPTQHST